MYMYFTASLMYALFLGNFSCHRLVDSMACVA